MAADDTVGLTEPAGDASGRPFTADPAPFEAFVREAQPAGTAFVRRLNPGLGHADIDDIVQTALMKMFRRWAAFGDRPAAKAYFFSVLRTVTTDHFRELARHQRKVERATLAYTEAAPDRRLGAIELEATLQNILDADPRLRSIAADLMAEYSNPSAMETALSRNPFTARRQRDLLLRGLRAKLEEAGLAHPRRDQAPTEPVREFICVCPTCQTRLPPHARSEASAPIRSPGAPPPTEQPRQVEALTVEQEHEFRQREWLAREINRLPEREQQVARLAASGATPAQIAERIGISANNARVTLCHAKKKLQARVNVTPERLRLLFRRPSLRHAQDCPAC